MQKLGKVGFVDNKHSTAYYTNGKKYTRRVTFDTGHITHRVLLGRNAASAIYTDILVWRCVRKSREGSPGQRETRVSPANLCDPVEPGATGPPGQGGNA